MDMLVIKIMNYAQRLVNADRASLFLIDSKTNELYATIFDVGFDDDIQDKMNSPRGAKETAEKLKSEEIRFALGTGIAGKCALSGEIFNIVDAYGDERFNRNIDQITGYRTDTILCMPIFIRGAVIGVVEMVNKRVGYFTKEDEEAFETFAVYCGLALHHAKLYDKIRRSEKSIVLHWKFSAITTRALKRMSQNVNRWAYLHPFPSSPITASAHSKLTNTRKSTT